MEPKGFHCMFNYMAINAEKFNKMSKPVCPNHRPSSVTLLEKL
jgi:hypothetical protein